MDGFQGQCFLFIMEQTAALERPGQMSVEKWFKGCHRLAERQKSNLFFFPHRSLTARNVGNVREYCKTGCKEMLASSNITISYTSLTFRSWILMKTLIRIRNPALENTALPWKPNTEYSQFDSTLPSTFRGVSKGASAMASSEGQRPWPILSNIWPPCKLPPL